MQLGERRLRRKECQGVWAGWAPSEFAVNNLVVWNLERVAGYGVGRYPGAGPRPSAVARGSDGYRSLPPTAIMTAIHKTDRVGAAIPLAPQAPDQDDD